MASSSADAKPPTTTTEPPAADQKPEQPKPAALGEDDEFEDFPVDGTIPPPTVVELPRGFPSPQKKNLC